MPAQSSKSLTPKGTPDKGPGSRPAVLAASTASAARRAPSRSTWTNAFNSGLDLSMASRHSSSTSTARTSPARTASAIWMAVGLAVTTPKCRDRPTEAADPLLYPPAVADRSYLSRLAGKARDALGITKLQDHITELEARVANLPTRGAPVAGPLYFGDNTALLATRWGARMLVDTRDVAMAPWLVLDGLWEPHVTSWLQESLSPGMVFVDVGANVGYFTLLGAKLVGPSGRVVAVEAHPRLAGILQRNVVLNGYHGFVNVHHRAAWSEPTSLEFQMRDHFTSSSSLGRIDAAGLAGLGDTVQSVSVEAVPLDDLLGGLNRVDVIKIDIEGAEVHAFQGLRRTLEANPHALVMFEWGRALVESVGDRPEDLAAIVDGYGFKLRLLETGDPIEPDALLALPYGNVLAYR